MAGTRSAQRHAATAGLDQSPQTYFGPALALYVAVSLCRLNEVVPILGRLYLGKVGAIVLIAAAFADIRSVQFQSALRTTVAKCMIALTVLAVLSVPGSYWPRQSTTFFQDQWPQTLLMFVCVLIGFTNRRTAYMCVAAMVLTTGLGAVELIVGNGLSNGGRLFIGSASSMTYDPNATAALFVTILPYAVFLATRRGPLRYPAMLTIPVLIAALMRTSSRGGTIALGVLGIALVVFAPKQRRLVYAGVLGLILVTALLVPHSGLVERFSDLSGSQDYNFSSRDGRIEVWKRGIGMMLSHPAFGIGVRAFEVANGEIAHSWINAHNALVQIGAELGIGGLIVFVTAAGAALRSAHAAVRRTRVAPTPAGAPLTDFDRGLATAAMCSLAAELTAAMFLSMAYDEMTIFVLAVPTALAMLTAASVRTASAPVPQAVTIGQPGWRSARRIAAPTLHPTSRPRV